MMRSSLVSLFASLILVLPLACVQPPGTGNTNNNGANDNGTNDNGTNDNDNTDGGGQVGGPALYAADGGGAANAMLYTVNTATAATTAVGAIGFPVTGLAFDANGTLFGATSDNPAKLITINTANGQGTEVANLTEGGQASSVEDITFAGERLLGWLAEGAGPVQYLVQIDTTTGNMTRVGNQDLVAMGGGLTFGGANDANLGFDLGFIAANISRDGGNNFTTEFTNVDVNDGSSFEGDNMMGNTGNITAMGFFQGVIYAVDGGGANGARLGSIDPTMGQFVLIGDLPDEVNALAGSVN